MSVSVLLVDDNRNFLRVLAYQMKEMGLDPRPATSAEEGLALLASLPVALVITDVSMPGMDGVEFLKQAGKRQNRVPFIVLTALESPELRRQVEENGAVFLTKSSGREELRRLVLTQLGRNVSASTGNPDPLNP